MLKKAERSTSNFITDCINGDALMMEVDDYIEKWHDGDIDITLHEYLGMTQREYSLFIESEIYLGLIISAHKHNTPVEKIIRDEWAVAARSDNAYKSKLLKEWLISNNLWD